ncbi:hypothetical protein [Thalassotalea atypica]|uniref:hypothetical protein n=1 Tax=Thalassotalea atypica TaxID=2054316 RepID=UPI002572B233|nr:hypothetical protein [Thalassotalea atypica]
MALIRVSIFIAALLILIYPIWGLVSPERYLLELLEVYPSAKDASMVQVKKAALMLWISNTVLSLSLLFLVMFIKQPEDYKFAKLSAIALFCYPIIQTVIEVFTSAVLYSHLDSGQAVVEFSAIKAFYLLMGLALVGIYKSQRELNKQPKQGIAS